MFVRLLQNCRRRLEESMFSQCRAPRDLHADHADHPDEIGDRVERRFVTGFARGARELHDFPAREPRRARSAGFLIGRRLESPDAPQVGKPALRRPGAPAAFVGPKPGPDRRTASFRVVGILAPLPGAAGSIGAAGLNDASSLGLENSRRTPWGNFGLKFQNQSSEIRANLINTPLQRGAAGGARGETVSTVFSAPALFHRAKARC